MTLNEFINELKHKTTKLLIIVDEQLAVFDSDVSTYVHWIKRGSYDNKPISRIHSNRKGFGFVIYIKGGE